jgi:DNA invertase Pin-like site-specific DNA recombinase
VSLGQLQEVDRMASQGFSGRAIAKVAGFSEATVRRILQSGRVNSSTMDGQAIAAPVA